MALVLATANLKGGVGKTATVLGLAEAATAGGINTAIIDLDPNCTVTETLEPTDLDAAGSKDLLRDDQDLSLADCLVDAGSDWPGIRICASDTLLSNREYDLTGIGAEDRLREAIKRDDGGAELILIDLPPSRGRIALSGLVAADLTLIPTTAGIYSARRMVETLDDFIPKARRYNPDLKVAGVLITKFAGRAEERRVLGQLTDSYGDLILSPPIPRHEVVATAFESLHLPLRQMHDGYADKVADAYADHLPAILAGGLTVGRRRPRR